MGMKSVEILMAVEEQFGITIADAEAENIRTPGQLIDFVSSKLAVTIATVTWKAYSRSEIALGVKEIVTDILGCKNYHEDADFVKDLGMS